MTDNRTTELRISEPLRGFIRHQSNRAYIDGGQSRWLTEIADKIDAKHEQAIAATLGSEREKQLELLVNQLWYLVNHRSGYGYAAALEAIEELGIEVDE